MKNFLNVIGTIYRQFNFILTSKQKWSCVRLLVLIIIGAFMEMLGVTLIVPFLQTILMPNLLESNKWCKKIAEVVGITSQVQLIVLVGIALIIVYLVKNLYLLFLAYKKAQFQCEVEKDLGVRIMNSYMHRPYSFHLDTDAGKLIAGVSVDTNGVYILIMQICTIIAELFSMLLISIFIIITDWVMALSIFLLVGSSLMAVTLGSNKFLKRLGDQFRIYSQDSYQHLTQAIAGIKEVMIANKENYFVDAYDHDLEKRSKTVIMQNFMTVFPTHFIEAVCVIGILIVLLMRVIKGDNLAQSIPQLAAFAVAAFRILPSAGKITAGFNNIIFYRKTLASTYLNLKEVEEYEESVKKEVAKRKEENQYEESYNICFEDSLAIENVYWKYPKSKEDVLCGLYLKIHKGESVAIIGESGAGKSTLTDVLLGLFQPQKGKIMLDGVDTVMLPSQWRKLIGYVPQTVFLTNDTLKSNVAFGLDENEINEAKVWNALEQAQLKSFVEELAEGINTIVGERGIKFSGGQRQRVAIARALYNEPEIIVLDEATSALDNETEKMVMEAIDALHGKKTMIIIAHRLTTIQNCDKIYEITGGIAVERNKQEVLNRQ